MIKFRLVAVLAVIFCPAITCHADDDPYCGIFAIYGAAASLGAESEFETLISSEYISDELGSTAEDLVRAAEKLGVRTTSYSTLSASSLLNAREPLILHVSSYGDIKRYTHWMLFLGMEDGKCRVANEEGTHSLLPVAEVLSRWDGLALAVHLDSSPKINYSGIENSSRCFWISIIVFLTILVCYFRRTGVVSWILIAGVFVILVTLSNFYRGERPGLNIGRVDYVVNAHSNARFEEISHADLSVLLKSDSQESCRLIDARYSHDFHLGSIGSSLSVPVDSTRLEITRKLKDVDANEMIVVFCLSDKCTFDQIVATKLSALGFTNIKLFQPGWRGWVEEERRGITDYVSD